MRLVIAPGTYLIGDSLESCLDILLHLISQDIPRRLISEYSRRAFFLDITCERIVIDLAQSFGQGISILLCHGFNDALCIGHIPAAGAYTRLDRSPIGFRESC